MRIQIWADFWQGWIENEVAGRVRHWSVMPIRRIPGRAEKIRDVLDNFENF